MKDIVIDIPVSLISDMIEEAGYEASEEHIAAIITAIENSDEFKADEIANRALEFVAEEDNWPEK